MQLALVPVRVRLWSIVKTMSYFQFKETATQWVVCEWTICDTTTTCIIPGDIIGFQNSIAVVLDVNDKTFTVGKMLTLLTSKNTKTICFVYSNKKIFSIKFIEIRKIIS